MKQKKSLGQHWLHDRAVLSYIADCADLKSDDTVLEIGPGLGTLTSELLRRAENVVAVEFDPELAIKLPKQFPGKKLQVINEDILNFDLTKIPKNYKVVANIPYYITNKIVQILMTAGNKPFIVVLLVQKEVAQRLAAIPGKMSILSVSAQVFAEVHLGDIVPAELFTPPPKVDSQVVILKTRPKPYISDINKVDFFRIVKAGFSSRRKKLKSSLSGGLDITKDKALALLDKADIDPNARAETLSLEDWARLVRIVGK